VRSAPASVTAAVPMRNRVILAVLTASVGWGLAGVGTRAAYELGASTLTVLAIRTAVATAALVVYTTMTQVSPTRLAWRHGGLVGALRIGLAPLLFMSSLNYISAGVEGLIITLVPATTAMMAAVLIDERVTRRQITGLAIGLVGTTLIALSGESGLGAEGDVVTGFLFAGAGVIVGSLSGVLQRRFAPRHDTAELALPMFISGLALALAVGIVTGFEASGGLGANLWVLLIILGLGSTLLPFGATLYASKHASAMIVAITGYIAPLVAVVGGVILLDEELTGVILIGGALASIGVALVGGVRRTPT
jgi:drug/metabolite transporter (DMT)-like permease